MADDNWLTRNSQGNPAANLNLRTGVETNPDEAADNATLARRFNLPPAAIEQDRALFKARAAAQDARDLTFDKPRTSEWLARSRQNAKVAHDDLGVLGTIESYATAPFRWARDNVLMPLAGGIDAAIMDETPARLQVPAIIKQAPSAIGSGTLRLLGGLAGVARAGSEASESMYDSLGVPLDFGLSAPMAAFFRNIQREAGATADRIGPDYNRVPGAIGKGILGGLESTPTSLAALATTVYTGSPLLGASLGGLQQGGESYGRARDQGLGVGRSLLYGGTDALVETGTEFLPQLTFLKQTKAGSSVLKRFVTNQLQEQLGEQTATVLQDLNAWATLPENKDKTFGDYLAARPEAALNTAIQTLVVGGATHAVISTVERAAELPAFRARRELAEQRMAEAHSQQLQTILEAAGQSKLRERDPVSFHDFMEAQTDEGPLEHVYVDGRVLNQTLEAGGPEAAALLEAMPSVREQLAQAVEIGGDVRIPTAELATALPGSAIEQQLVDHLRVDPLMQSAAEAREQANTTADRLQAGFEAQLGEQVDNAEFNASRDKVTQHFTDQLAGANRFTSDVNDRYANLLGSFYAVQAAKLGITPEQMLQRYPLQVRAVDEATGAVNRLGQNDTLVNIGLSTAELGDGSQLALDHVLDVVRKHGGSVLSSAVHASDTEPTAVLRLERPLTEEQATAISDELQQEAIAQLTGSQGELYGRSAANWRPFNPDFFLLGDGTRASDQIEEATSTGQSLAAGERLEGLPYRIKVDGVTREFGPFEPARTAAAEHMAAMGMPYAPPRTYAKVNEERATRIAEEFEAMKHDPNDPLVKAAYDAMIAETIAQWQAIKATGLKVEFITGEDPYGNPRNAILDVIENNHLWVFPTSEGFGGSESADVDISGNPLLATVPGEEISGRPVQANDIFRIVHDYFGHIKEGVGFRADGEENAWRSHAAMYSPLARRAMTTETRGQNSWVNYGPHAEFNRTANGAETQYAPQKIGLLPEWVSEEGAGDPSVNQLNQSTARDVVEQKARELADQVPGFAKVAPYLTDEEKAATRKARAKKLVELFDTMPDAEEMASVAFAGRAKRGWYERSALALLDIFGVQDAPRFAGLLAALSPQTSVENNAVNAIKTWVNWDAAGRPTDRKAIIDILGKSVQGGKGVGSVLNAWINNSVNALAAEDPHQIELSGPKVNSFMLNLSGVVDEVTNDAWMANYAMIDQSILGGQMNVKTGKKGKSTGYTAMSAVVRRAAEIVSERTGESWTPAEIQETVWSWTKSLYEARDRGDGTSAPDLLKAGGLTHDVLATTPDFAMLFTNGVYRRVLEFGGYGEQLDNLESSGRADGSPGEQGSVFSAEGSGLAEAAYQQHLLTAAQRIEQRRNARRGVTEEAQGTLFQGAADNVQVMLARESMGDFPLVRDASGKLLLDVGEQGELFRSTGKAVFDKRPRFQERANNIAEKLGEPIEAVTSDDPRLIGAQSLIHNAPPVDENGMVHLQHWSMDSGLTRTDPEKWGRNLNFLPPSERARLGSAKGRTYFGIASGEPGGYKIEFGPSNYEYEATVPADKLYDIMGDPDGFKKELAGKLGGLEAAIHAAGYSGYWVKNGELGLVATMFDPVDVRQVPHRDLTPEQVYAQKTRGYITFGQDVTAQPSTITLLNASDLSTFLHEAGHFFLEVQSHMAAQPGAPQAVVDDMAASLKWMGVEGGHAQWLGMTLEQKREYHEKFARGFEAYLFEGKAPSIAMRGVFQRFRAWLVSVYKNNVANLRAPLNDEIRGVFARMLASTEAIRAAEADAQLGPIFTEQPAGMTDAEWQEYQALGISATADAIDDLQTRSLRDMRFAKRVHARELKRLKDAIAAQREQVEEEVRAELGSQPVYRAIEFLRRGTVDGQPVEGPTKFDVDAFNALYEGYNEQEREAVKKQLGFGKYGMFSRENGVNPAQVADLFGYTSADELVTALLKAPDLQTEIDAAVEQRMLERYGDINSPEALDAAASAAIHNEVRARFVATELGALERGVGKPRMLAKAARQYADALIARLKVRDVRPAQYEAAERRAAAAAQKALKGNDIALATAEKRNQLLNLYATKAARTAQDEVRKTLDYFRKFARQGTRQNVDPEYLDQIDAMLDRFELRTGVSDAQLARRKSLLEWIEKQRALGFEPAIDPALENEARRQSYRDLTMDEMRGLRDSIRNIEHLGRLKRELLKNKERRELAAAVEAGAAEIRDNAYKVKRQPVGARTWLERARGGVDEFFAIHRKFGSLIREMSGGKDGGVLWDLFTRPMNEAGGQEAVMTAEATQKLNDIFKRLQKDNTFKRVYEPAIDASISLETRLMVALNWGNATNRARVMDGEGWTQAQAEAVLAPLTEQHWQFVKDVWSHINSYWPEIAAKEKRVTGVEPEKVEAEAFPFTTSDGQTIVLPGGYFPIKYDPDKSSKAEADTAAEVQRQITQGLYTRASTRRGHTKARVDTVERSIRKDFGVIFEHNAQVIHDLSWHETLIDMNRLLGSGQIDEAIREHYGPAVVRVMRKTLEDIAVGGIPAQNVLERGVNYLRAGATVAGLGWNLMTSLFQPLGLTNSMVRIGPKYVGRGIARVFRDAASMEATTSWIYAQSDFMRLRAQTQQREIAEIRQQFQAKGPVRSTLDRVPGVAPTLDVVGGSFFVLITKAQLIADVPTWAGAYEKAVDEGNAHDRAVALADQAVIDSQGDGTIKDLAGVQRGGPFQKLWTNFYSWFNVAYNQLAESVNQTRRVGPERLPLMAVDFLLIAVVPALMASLLRGAVGGDDWDELKKRIANDQASGYLGFMFGLRELGAAFGVGNGYSGPAGARAIDATIKLGKQAQQGEADEAFFKAANNAAGVLFHYPAGQVQRTYLGVEALADGKTKNPMVIMTGPPPKDR